MNLREDKYFTDVTLACEDGQQVEAHKVILAASSPFFQRLLERQKHPHPLVYMKGVKIEDLCAVVDFLYFGEARIKAEDVNSFLAIAKELQLRGLLGEVEENLENALNLENTLIHDKSKLKARPKAKSSIRSREDVKREQTDVARCEAPSQDKIVPSASFPGDNITDVAELEEKVQSLMKKSENNYINGNYKAVVCKLCGKEGKGQNIKDHIEATHLDGIVLPCNWCQKTFRCRNSLSKHRRVDHFDHHSKSE